MLLKFLAVSAFFFAVSASGYARAEVISTGVGFIRGTLVTSRQVQIQHLLDTAFEEPVVAAKLKYLPLDSKAFAQALRDTLLEMAVALESQNFNVIQVSEADLKEREKKCLKTLGDLAVWKRWEVQPQELETFLRNKIQAKKFIEFRAQSSVLPVTDIEAGRYFNENRLKFGNLPFENFKENIKSFLSRTQVDLRMKDWYDVLLSKYQVKNLIAEI